MNEMSFYLVRIFSHTTGILITAIRTVRFLVTEQRLGNALSIPTLQVSIWTHGLFGVKIGFDQAGLGQAVAVINLESLSYFKSNYILFF